jgi:hypothetical protein
MLETSVALGTSTTVGTAATAEALATAVSPEMSTAVRTSATAG